MKYLAQTPSHIKYQIMKYILFILSIVTLLSCHKDIKIRSSSEKTAEQFLRGERVNKLQSVFLKGNYFIPKTDVENENHFDTEAYDKFVIKTGLYKAEEVVSDSWQNYHLEAKRSIENILDNSRNDNYTVINVTMLSYLMLDQILLPNSAIEKSLKSETVKYYLENLMELPVKPLEFELLAKAFVTAESMLNPEQRRLYREYITTRSNHYLMEKGSERMRQHAERALNILN